MSFENHAIAIINLSKSYPLYSRPSDRLKQFIFRRKKYFREFLALSNVSLTINKGETVGIVGRNGSGKSTLLQIICGTLQPTSGAVAIQGRISALLELGAGFNPEFTGEENIYLSAAIQGLSRAEIKEKYAGIVEFSGLAQQYINQPVKTYSSGMYVRLAFSVAIASDPDILIVDEALSVGDEAFQRKCFARIRDIQNRGGTVVFVSHSAASVNEICNRAILLDAGEILLDGRPKMVLTRYHKLLFAAEEKREKIRAEIKNFSEDYLPSFNPDLKPETTISYESRGATIKNPKIEKANGNEINLLERGREYYFRYSVEFDKDCSDVRFGMLIKSKTGIELGGASIPFKDGGIIPAGSQIEVRFKFSALLAPGSYFLNAGCSGFNNGEWSFLHRITDAAMFSVLPGQDATIGGMVDFLIEADINIV